MSEAPAVVLKKGKSRFVECGHPWIFSGAIASTRGEPGPERAIQILRHDGELLGWGVYSPRSQIRVRQIEAPEGFDGELGEGFFAERLEVAAARRARLGLPGEQTTGFRLVNSEGDGLPGLIVDRFERLVTVQLTTLPMVRRREAIVGALRRVLGEVAVREVGAPEGIASKEGFEPVDAWHGQVRPERVEFRENGAWFIVQTAEFQKTGHYADMREHRAWVARQAPGVRVLDGYSYTGGFGVQAARAGAERVVCVDTSAAALERVTENAARNEVDVEVEQASVDDYLRSAYDRQVRFDIVVLDPPKLAPTKKHRGKALKLYQALCIQAARVLAPGGMLCVGSCSEPIGIEGLERALGAAVARTGRALRTVRAGHQAADHPHPCAMPEGRYLSFVAAV